MIKRKIIKKRQKDLLSKQKVKPGDFYNIPAGLAHGLCAGVKVLEVSDPEKLIYKFFEQGSKPVSIDWQLERAISANKKTSSILRPTSMLPLTFKNEVGTQLYTAFISHVKTRSIVVDLKKEIAYMCEDELIDFDDYVVISLNH